MNKQQNSIKTTIGVATIPIKFNDASVKTFNTEIYSSANNRDLAKSTKITAQNIVNGFCNVRLKHKFVIIEGEKGSGKTKLACAIINDLKRKVDVEAIYRTEPEIFGLCIQKNHDKIAASKLSHEIVTAPLLIIDNFLSTQFMSLRLFGVYNELFLLRSKLCKLTICASSLSKANMDVYFNETAKMFLQEAEELTLPKENINKILVGMIEYKLQKYLEEINRY